MAEVSQSSLIKEGDQVIVRKLKNLKVVPVRRNCKLYIERCKFYLDSAIGFPYGTSFEVCDSKLVKVQGVDTGADVELEPELEDGIKDNRNLTDTTLNQKLSSDNIRSMRKQGIHGEEIVEQLIQNSATFNQKNEFARQKYIKKKKNKYVPVIKVLKPNARLLLEMYYNKGPSRVCNLRVDSLAQVLTQANVRAGNKMLVVESCVGLVVGAIMERMAGQGNIIQFYSGCAPVQQVVQSFDFPKSYQQMLHSYPLNKVSSLVHPAHRDTENNTSDIQMDVPDDTFDQSLPSDTSGEDSQSDNSDKATEGATGACESDNERDKPQQSVKRKIPDEKSQKEREEKREAKRKYFQEVKSRIEEANSDGLIVVSKFHPAPIVMKLIEFVAPSRPIAIFCSEKEPLMDLYVQLRDRGGVVLLRLTETWLRGHQVLPNRTHPTIKMSGTGGYILTGTTVMQN